MIVFADAIVFVNSYYEGEIQGGYLLVVGWELGIVSFQFSVSIFSCSLQFQ